MRNDSIDSEQPGPAPASESSEMLRWPSHLAFRNIPERQKRDFGCLILALLTIFVFLPVAKFDFINYDDPGYVFENPRVSTGLSSSNFVWAFSSLHGGISYWHPLTWLSHQLDCQLFGLKPGAHHLTNVVFHTANTVLCFLLFLALTGRGMNSLLTAGLFSLHPFHVESVAWISERKDVLSTFFLMLTILAYCRYVKKSDLSRYSLVLVLFACALMSKPMVVTLPFLLLLLDYWPLGRWNNAATRLAFDSPSGQAAWFPKWTSSRVLYRLIWEKLPLVVLSIASAVVTWWGQVSIGTVAPMGTLSLSDRISNCLVSYAAYIQKTFWPDNLSILYQRHDSSPILYVVFAGLILAAISFIVVRVRKRHPYALVGWFWFIVTLLPVIGFIQVGPQSMADRYSYIPILGLFVAIVWSLDRLSVHCGSLRLAGALGLGVLTVCAICSRAQLNHWRSSEAVFTQAVKIDPKNAVAHNNLGDALMRRGQVGVAAEHFKASIALEPKAYKAHINLGDLLVQQGRFNDATNYYGLALHAPKERKYAHAGLGFCLTELGHTRAAITHYLEALRLDEGLVMAAHNLASIYATTGERDLRDGQKAVALAQRVCELTQYSHPGFINTLAAAYTECGMPLDAAKMTNRATEITRRRGAAGFRAPVWRENGAAER